jgi:hypothetical protein
MKCKLIMNTRRDFLGFVAAGLLTLASSPSWAAPPRVEIIAMPHPPVKVALQPLRAWLAKQDGKLRVIEIDAESPAGKKRLLSVGLTGHVPMLILIDGKHSFQRKDSSRVEFVNFPDVASSPPGIRGNWVAEDVEAVLTSRMK